MSMTMVETGHVAHARAMLNEDYYLAWGDLPPNYPDPWGLDEVPPESASTLASTTLVRGETNSDLITGFNGILKLVSITDSDGVSYIIGQDAVLNSGLIEWSDTHAPAVGVSYTVVFRYYTEDLTTLLNEVGRRKVTMKSFVVEDPLTGDIVANGTRWRRVETPTRHIYLMFSFDATDAVDTSIYQVGIYIGTQVDPTTPPGLYYYLPSQITENGSMYMVENLEPFPRNIGKREIFEYVITY